MGEYADYKGQRIKIGTCESMYYLRADQMNDVRPVPGALDVIRFRFPFPAEDGTEPGDFDYPPKGPVVDYPSELPAQHDKVSVQTGDHAWRRLSAYLPCPTVAPELWHQYVQSYTPAVRIMYQGYRNGHLAVIVECAYCDGMWNLPELEQAERLVVSIRSQADGLRRLGESRREDTLRRHGPDVGDPMAEREVAQAAELHIVADRILAGYVVLDAGDHLAV